MVKISVLDAKGHRQIELPEDEAMEFIRAEGDRFFVVDAKTKRVIKTTKLRKNQEIALIPKVTGG